MRVIPFSALRGDIGDDGAQPAVEYGHLSQGLAGLHGKVARQRRRPLSCMKEQDEGVGQPSRLSYILLYYFVNALLVFDRHQIFHIVHHLTRNGIVGH
jgi:hypothetical protein